MKKLLGALLVLTLAALSLQYKEISCLLGIATIIIFLVVVFSLATEDSLNSTEKIAGAILALGLGALFIGNGEDAWIFGLMSIIAFFSFLRF